MLLLQTVARNEKLSDVEVIHYIVMWTCTLVSPIVVG
jgi:hypothetical protein